MKTKHTPGPWWYENETAQICANHPLDEQYIARIYDADSVHSETLPQEANAKLIAAAPELLDIVQYLASGIPVWDDPGSLEESVYHLEKRAKRLIAKIELGYEE